MASPAQTDPYAQYGGRSSATSSPDPYAQYGGQAASTGAPAPPTSSSTTTPPPDPTTDDHSFLSDLNTGFGRAVDRSMVLPEKLLSKVPVLGDLIDQDQIKHDQTEGAKPNANMAQSIGAGIESLAEFMAGDAALKGLSTADKLSKIVPVLTKLEKASPRLVEILGNAIRQGTVATAQSAEHGDSAGDAMTSGAVTAATAGLAESVLPSITRGAKSLIDKIRPGTTEIAGETIPVLASQKPGAAPIAAKAASMGGKGTEAIAEAQQQGGRRAITNVAQRATRDALDRVNQVRQAVQPVTDPARLLEAPEGSKGFQFTIDGPPVEESTEGPLLSSARKKQIGTRVVEGKGPGGNNYDASSFRPVEDGAAAATPTEDAAPVRGSHREPVWQYLSSAKPGEAAGAQDVVGGGGRLVTSDSGLVQRTLSQLDGVMDSAQFKEMSAEQQAHIRGLHKSLTQQLDMYHATARSTPHFEPVDSAALAGHVSSFGEAADQLEATAKPVYQKLDEVSGGQFTALRNQAKAASKVMFQPGSIDAYDKALESKAAADKGIQDLFTRHGTSVSRTELQSANAAWRDAQVLDNLHRAIEGSIKGAPQDIADSLGTKRIIRGDTLQARLNKLVTKTPTARANIERVIGKDGLENLYRVSDLLSKPETVSKTQNAAKEIARELTRRVGKGALIGGAVGSLIRRTGAGALAGAALEDGGRFVLRQAAINPRVGTMVDYAVRHQVNPKIFAPLIAGALNSEPSQPTQENSK
jgi:hypothetical protein